MLTSDRKRAIRNGASSSIPTFKGRNERNDSKLAARKVKLDHQVRMEQLRNERRQGDQTFIVNLFKAISWLLMAVLGYWFHLAGLGLWSALKEIIRRSSE